MIDSLGIYKKANILVKRCNTRDALKIADQLGIKIYYNNYEHLLGMYTYRWKQRMILLNSNLDDPMLQMVVAHEIGHDAFHRYIAANSLQEFTLFNMKNQTEYVANAFAAHLLIDNEDVLSFAQDGYDVVHIVSKLHMHINLLLIKMQEMNKMGYTFNVPYRPKTTFSRKYGHNTPFRIDIPLICLA